MTRRAANTPARLWGRRRGRPLSATQQRLIDERLPELALPLDTPAPADARALFPGAVEAVWLEIGFGGGEHLIAQASAQLAIGVIGVEPFENGMAKALAAIEARKLRNIRLHQGDARAVLGWLPSASVGRVFLLYPDPWPKRRQVKRRFVSRETLDDIARVMRPDAELRFASDIPDYVAWTRRHVASHPRLTLAADRAEPWPGWSGTRYEAKAIAAGRSPTYLTITRAPA